MSWVLTQPFGLLGLLSLPLIVWLHRHVVVGERRVVSHLGLWLEAESAASEGRRRDRPPIPRVLAAELAAATLLSLWLAGLDWAAAPSAAPRIALVIDDTASMGGGHGAGAPLAQARVHLQAWAKAHPAAKVSLILAGPTPRLLGDAELSMQQAITRLDSYVPAATERRLDAALTLVESLGLDSDNLWIASDDPDIEHPRLLAVGDPADNTAIVAAAWTPGSEPFVAIRHLGSAGVRAHLRIEVDGRLREQAVDIPADGEIALTVPVAEDAQRISVHLPVDALGVDNAVTLVRPPARVVGIHVATGRPALSRAFAQVARAIPGLDRVERALADVVVDESASPAQYRIAFEASTKRAGASAADELQLEIAADPFSPLARGLDLEGLIWYGQAVSPEPPSHALLATEAGALVHHGPDALELHIDLQRSNLLEHPTFPILIANLAAWLDVQKGGLTRRNFRQGEQLSVRRSHELTGTLRLALPSGDALTFREQDDPVSIGRLWQAGDYTLGNDQRQESFVANFLSADESDLRRRRTLARVPELAARVLRSRERSRLPRAALLAATALLLLLSWHWLGTSRGAA